MSSPSEDGGVTARGGEGRGVGLKFGELGLCVGLWLGEPGLYLGLGLG